MNIIRLKGRIKFDVEDKTKKHIDQSAWKKMAMVIFEGDICEYYSWFIMRRYNILLNMPIRGPHVSFINDSMRDLTKGGEITEAKALERWEEVKKKWDGKEITIVLDLNAKTDSKHWWLNIPHEERDELQSIRTELGLTRPHWGMHMSIGYARPGIWAEQSEYIHRCIVNGFSLN